jgi:hypothetical protein
MSEAPLMRQPCGCTYRDERWVKLCEPCEKEWQVRHDRANADRLNQQGIQELLS